MKRVYVAGPYSADNVMDVLKNIGRGQRAALDVFLSGNSPFCPWLDHHYVFQLQAGENLTVPDFYKMGMKWLEVSDCMYVMPDSENSKGVALEVEFAVRKGIPIFYDFVAMLKWTEG